MSTLTDLIAEALREHPDATDRSADDGCWCRTPGTAGRYDQHAAAIITAVVADWLVSVEAVAVAARIYAQIEPGEDWPTNAELGGSLTGTRDDEYRAATHDEARDVLAALAAEARKGADQ